VPLVALVAVKGENRGAYLAAGVDAYASKPIRGRELHRVLARFLCEGECEEPALLAG
jgi:CheY-like chemotaxis protein